jgi:hypothetical protein
MWNPTSATGLGMTVHPFPAAPDTLDPDVRVDVRDVSLQQAGALGSVSVPLDRVGSGR